jgi:hypothetical protein
MNIFAVNNDPIKAAQDLCDKHVVKMIVEGCQMLSTNHRICGSHVIYAPVNLYKASFANHPCTIWARSSYENCEWLARHTYELCVEYTMRYDKIHSCQSMAAWFLNHIVVPYNATKCLTPFAQAMPDKYKHENAVVAYRSYYLGEKSKFAKWKMGDSPSWFTEKNPMLDIESLV